MTVHSLKCDPVPFAALWAKDKTHEVRTEIDRTFSVGDSLRLREQDVDRKVFTGRVIHALVTHVQKGYGLPQDLAVLSISETGRVNGSCVHGRFLSSCAECP